MKNPKRYVVQVEFYLTAEDDWQANELAQKYAANERVKNDNLCSVVELYEAPFGKLTHRPVKLTKPLPF